MWTRNELLLYVASGSRWRAENWHGAWRGDELRQAGGVVAVAGVTRDMELQFTMRDT